MLYSVRIAGGGSGPDARLWEGAPAPTHAPEASMHRPIQTLAVVAPSGPVPRDRLRAGLRVLADLGRTVEVFFDPEGPAADGFLAAPDAARAGAFLAAAASGADAVMAARGGYGAYRLLEQLPAAPPGPAATLIGFSDVTALLLGLRRRWGWAGIHGPNVTTLPDLDPDSLEAFGGLLDAAGSGDRFEGLETLHPGQAAGPLIGGNLSVLCSLLGTPEEVDLAGGILFVEDVGEAPYRLDRLLRQLASCRTFPGLRGLAVGDLGVGFDDAVRRGLTGLCAARGLPAVAGLPVGHGPANRPLILGSSTTLDAHRGRLVSGQS